MNNRLLKYAKNVLRLTMQDFRDYPVWVETDNIDDEDEVAPLNVQALPDEENIYYLAADFELADGSSYEGHLRWSWGQVTFMALDNLAEIPLIGKTRRSLGESSQTYAQALNRAITQTFPIRYSTRVGFAKGQPIQGTVTH